MFEPFCPLAKLNVLRADGDDGDVVGSNKIAVPLR